MTKRFKVLLLAYVVSPYRGSEYSVAWNFISRMSKVCDLTVLYGASGSHMGDIEELRDYLVDNPIPNVDFIAVPAGKMGYLLNAANRKGWLTYSFYFAYNLWHKQAYRIAQSLVKANNYDLVHYLGPIGYRESGYLWKLDLPYVWGPISGATNVPFSLLSALPFSGKCKFTFRTVANWLQLRCSLRLRRALRRVDVLMTATTENKAIFEKVLGKESTYLPENGIESEATLDFSKFSCLDKINLIWIGRVDAGKALRLLIDALARSGCASRFAVHVVGDGPLRPALESMTRESGLGEYFVWHGHVSRDIVQKILGRSHLHVITSISEGNPTTIWEAMRCGVPTLTIDHCGMRDTVTAHNGIKIPLCKYESLVDRFATELQALDLAPQRLRVLAENVVLDAKSYQWGERVPFFLKKYEEAIEHRRVRRDVYKKKVLDK